MQDMSGGSAAERSKACKTCKEQRMSWKRVQVYGELPWATGFRRSMHLGAWLSTLAFREPNLQPLAVSHDLKLLQSDKTTLAIAYNKTCDCKAVLIASRPRFKSSQGAIVSEDCAIQVSAHDL